MSELDARIRRSSVTGPYGEERDAVLLVLQDPDGRRGIGEASPLPGYSPDSLDGAAAALARWRARWVSGDAAPPPEESPSAACAADTALLDLEARRRSVPLHRVLRDAGPVPERAVAGLVSLGGVRRAGAPPSTDARAEAADLVRRGFRTIKVKMGRTDTRRTFEAELRELEEIRAALPEVSIRIDVNGRWNLADAPERLAELAHRIAPEFVEQPVAGTDLFALGPSPTSVAADESLRQENAVRRLADAGGCDVLVLKPMLLGGLRPCLRLAREGAERGMRAVVSHAMGGPVAHASACELALAIGAEGRDGGGERSTALAVGLAGHDGLPQRRGAWIRPAPVVGHGVGLP